MPESRPKRRWFHLSPDRLIFGLLAVEGFLLLSEGFQWFAFNEKKGWTVLIAVAAVCVAVVVMLLWFAASFLFRWRFQFSVRSLVVLVVAVAIPCCWLAVRMQGAERQREAVEAIEEMGGNVLYDDEWDASGASLAKVDSPATAWVTRLLGGDFLADVDTVVFSWPEKVGDVVFEHIKGLTHVKSLELSSTQITDAGLEHIEGLTDIKELNLSGTQITDAGLEHLRGLTTLEKLKLHGTQVTSTGLEHLSGLTRLEHLYLRDTQVTDAGLKNLKGLTQLKYLDLCYTHVTEEGIRELRKDLMPRRLHGNLDLVTLFPQAIAADSARKRSPKFRRTTIVGANSEQDLTCNAETDHMSFELRLCCYSRDDGDVRCKCHGNPIPVEHRQSTLESYRSWESEDSQWNSLTLAGRLSCHKPIGNLY